MDSSLYRSLVGSLRYLTCTRPDILFATGLVNRYMETPKSSHLMAAKRILRYIKGTIGYGLLYASSGNEALFGFSDSDWAGCYDDRKSTTGYFFFQVTQLSLGFLRSNLLLHFQLVKLSTLQLQLVYVKLCG